MEPQVISLVVAMNQERVIGANNRLPWHIPEDLAYFKQVTFGKPIIMGRKTFESIGKVLPGRKNIVISRNNFYCPDIITYSSLENAIVDNSNISELCIIGGGEIFNQAIGLANKIYLTVVDYPVVNPSAWFPEFDLAKWHKIKTDEFTSSSGIKCCIKEYILSS